MRQLVFCDFKMKQLKKKYKESNMIYISGDHYYRLSDGGFDTGYPRPIHWDWGDIETPIDAALTWPNGWTFIFKVNTCSGFSWP